MASKAQYIIGVDTGGTFTDVVVLGGAGEVWTAKASTTPDDFSRGVMDAVKEAAGAVAVEISELLGQTTLFKHGSTVATNALITRNGCKVGLITTMGFEDTTEIMRAIGRVDGLSGDEIKHVTWITKPDPFVPRERVVGVRERMDYQGNEIVPLNRADVMDAIRRLIEDDKVEAIAVSLMHAWANPKHEEEIRALTAEADPRRKVYWSFGSSLSQVAGEYARANTAILNSYLGPTVERYLKGLETKLKSGGLKGPLLIMQGNGGVAHREHVSAIANLQSGPAGGMIASAYVAGVLKHENVITTDMGGTSFDVGLITDGYWRYAQEPIVERFRMLQPIIDIESIGAGGGTIAQVEAETGRLLVGPRSAGASPGPVCYDAGGEQVTVTDADLALGIIDPDYFLGGKKSLNKEKALRVIEEKIARPLKLKVHEAAAGIYDIVNAKMSDLIRRQVVRTGYLPEEFVIYAFGGAGPVHASGFAAELGIKKIYIFATSPVFSAFGAAAADVMRTRVLSCQYVLPADPATINQRLDTVEEELSAAMSGEGFKPNQIEFRRYYTMRYRRQSAGVELPASWQRFNPKRMAEIQTAFEKKYVELYGVGAGYTKAGIEISEIRVDAVGKVAKPRLSAKRKTGGNPRAALKGKRRVFFARPQRKFIDTPVYDYDRLGVGAAVKGPAIIELPFTTTLVPPDHKVTVDSYMNLVMEVP
ncbi:MAG: hydantoinase/oxoprolinase family protein [Deltaproteobacteria bacterium]|nr:hydantoinase/oxoprolinase family protein [Deltaproteobacteria bacterium]MBI2363396.1 hydantoinase/oxoprolinase family protein [Deltaproteobacteria bacterium]MBI2531440.1 hydantoinase/oxoprolinase family protein [Deltaproteobacteria bacterium]MBI3064523.1 hydantoinase/oxoprolinase family protein [Deltaproteobacteria bacterium]